MPVKAPRPRIHSASRSRRAPAPRSTPRRRAPGSGSSPPPASRPSASARAAAATRLLELGQHNARLPEHVGMAVDEALRQPARSAGADDDRVVASGRFEKDVRCPGMVGVVHLGQGGDLRLLPHRPRETREGVLSEPRQEPHLGARARRGDRLVRALACRPAPSQRRSRGSSRPCAAVGRRERTGRPQRCPAPRQRLSCASLLCLAFVHPTLPRPPEPTCDRFAGKAGCARRRLTAMLGATAKGGGDGADTANPAGGPRGRDSRPPGLCLYRAHAGRWHPTDPERRPPGPARRLRLRHRPRGGRRPDHGPPRHRA